MPVTLPNREKTNDRAARATPAEPPKRRYEKPRLIDYGPVSKLTQTGGITTTDGGNMRRVCL
jgi:hypothetical protein